MFHTNSSPNSCQQTHKTNKNHSPSPLHTPKAKSAGVFLGCCQQQFVGAVPLSCWQNTGNCWETKRNVHRNSAFAQMSPWSGEKKNEERPTKKHERARGRCKWMAAGGYRFRACTSGRDLDLVPAMGRRRGEGIASVAYRHTQPSVLERAIQRAVWLIFTRFAVTSPS